MEKEEESLKHLFQQEFSKMVAVISKSYGLQYIETAEDIVSETFLTAAETWGQKGMPENPTAWLYAVAKQKTLYLFRRNKIFTEKIVPQIKSVQEDSNVLDEMDFSSENIKDSQLQMMFAICNPAIVSESQIGLALRILCGFGIDEIAEAFLTNKETINKRLFRAKEKLRTEKIKLELPSEDEIVNRLDNVLHIIYLLFNEGYYSKTQNQILQKELCLEAMRLCTMLTEYDKTNTPKTNALMALMCFHASRFEARKDAEHDFISYEQQDENLWDKDLVTEGILYMEIATRGNEISSYHLEAGIAFWHCQKTDTKEKWENILRYYDLLLQINYSPAVALNRLYALSKVRGKQAALKESGNENLIHNHFYFLLLGELYKDIDDHQAKAHYQKAFSLAKTQAEKDNIINKMEQIR